MKNNKTPDELLKQYYLTAEELTVIIPHLKIEKARIYIREIREQMRQENIFVPETIVGFKDIIILCAPFLGNV